MGEVKAVLAGEKSPEYWEGYRKCMADREEDHNFDEQLKKEERRRLLVALAGDYAGGVQAWPIERQPLTDEFLVPYATDYAFAQLAEIDARLDAEGGK